MDTGDPLKPVDEHDAANQAQSVTEEELFETYLTARLEQALDTLNRAREELAGQPEDFSRALQVMRRVHELRELREQLKAQRSRVETARAAAGLEPVSAEEPRPPEQAAPSQDFRAAQSEQADRVMAALATQPRTCPSCQALLTTDIENCYCGYAVEVAPGLSGEDAPTTDPSVAFPRTTN